MLDDVDAIDFEKGGGLVPAIVQDSRTLRVLMLGYMDRAALLETLESGEATFFSRSRGGRWRKGETSGNRLHVRGVSFDCDRDAILVSAAPVGPTCHTGAESCFGEEAPSGVLGNLERTITARAALGDEGSYTARLLQDGVKRISQKVGEEGVECALAGAAGSAEELCNEAADLIYHVAVLLHARGRSFGDVFDVLESRAKP
ncbi:MAG: bifunctional phosphoribosyl-AMP cyclohydrolase/phosphoribosyl-ATP diphosphatase HisIE [Alphaproteobacteria bacterium]|nr:bifunctional phosphoribosyl-AMP cyclohydrolase/phosphoribosyl-ATP diphosphatase HisIE [Alphaproteobacteria bacterium]